MNIKLMSPAISVDDLSKIVSNKRVVVVHCWAEWNPNDYVLAEWLSSIQSKFAKRLTILSLNTSHESAWAFCREYQIVNLPALICFVGGTWYETMIGLRPEMELIAQFQEWSEIKTTHK